MLNSAMNYIKEFGNAIMLDEVEVTAKRPSGWSRFWSWVGRGLDNLEKKMIGNASQHSGIHFWGNGSSSWLKSSPMNKGSYITRDVNEILDIIDLIGKHLRTNPNRKGLLRDRKEMAEAWATQDIRALYRSLTGANGSRECGYAWGKMFRKMTADDISSRTSYEQSRTMNHVQEVKVPAGPYTYNYGFSTNTAKAALYRPINDSTGEFMRYIEPDSLQHFDQENPLSTSMIYTKYKGVVQKKIDR
jgi:hypothetical protein